MNGGEDSTAQGRHRLTVSSVALGAQSSQRSGPQQTDTDPVGLRKFDLGLVPASVTPPKTWRHAAWFTVLCSASVLMSLLFAVNALVGHSRPATIDALPNYPGSPGLLPTTTSTAGSSVVPPSTTRWPDSRPVSDSGVAPSTSRQHRDDTSTHPTQGGPHVDGGPTNGVNSSPIGGPIGAPVGDHAGDAAHPGNQGSPPASWTHAGAPPTTAIETTAIETTALEATALETMALETMPIQTMAIETTAMHPAPSPSTSSTEPGVPPPTSSTHPTRVPLPNALPNALPTITTTSEHGTPSGLTLDVAKLVELTQRLYNGLDKDVHDAFAIATSEPGAAGDKAVQKRYPGITRMRLDAIEVDVNPGVTPSTVRATKQDASAFRRRRARGFATDGVPPIRREQVVSSEGRARATAADSTSTPLPHSPE